ncbi:hypothetical protein [Leptospira phage LE3]|uniref:Uncharacterized protein n=2 Tax=Nylescharonvirus TaxID=2843431 RepID=A0A343LEB2_9CAUD|nr:hypothetical protein HWB33_gp11 [Leptospira phage LE3]YP_009835484.1 hypothetical protein HWB34_gp09 [Leptospira phage LE4]ATN94983.1 hypothetical protein [Leptospira phage LE3]ATN95022.1 hypothetical protein [Leptospira phage LE4]
MELGQIQNLIGRLEKIQKDIQGVKKEFYEEKIKQETNLFLKDLDTIGDPFPNLRQIMNFGVIEAYVTQEDTNKILFKITEAVKKDLKLHADKTRK